MASAVCDTCGSVGLHQGTDGYHYCTTCGTQSQQFLEEEVDDLALVGSINVTRAGQRNISRFAEEEALKKLHERLQRNATAEDDLDAEMDPEAARAREAELQRIFSQKPGEEEEAEQVRATLASQYRSQENVHVWAGAEQVYPAKELPARMVNHVRSFYLEGVQTILQMQCETLVKDHGVNPVICGIAASIWLRFVSSSRVLDSDWPEEAILLGDALHKQRTKAEPAAEIKDEPEEAPEDQTKRQKLSSRRQKWRVTKKERERIPYTPAGRRSTAVWVENLQERVPLRATLSIVFLACHIAREPVLPSDLSTWATRGKLPYVSAFLKIEQKKFLGPDMRVIHIPEIDVKSVFRPVFITNGRMVEMAAAHIAARLGLELPPINFYGLYTRFIPQLGLPLDTEILARVVRLYEWIFPEGLWICGRSKGFPSRAYLMAMLVVTLKLTYHIDGHAQSSLYWPSVQEMLRVSRPPDAMFQGLLDCIEKKLMEDFKSDDKISDYLKYCEDVVFPNVELSPDQSVICDYLWSSFQKFLQEQDDDETGSDLENGELGQEQKHQISDENDDHDEPENDYTLGSAGWSRAPTVKVENDDRKATGSAAQEQDQQRQPPKAREEQELDSDAIAHRQEAKDVQTARLRLLKTISYELKRCGFKLIPAQQRSNGCGDDYFVYSRLKASPTSKKRVHGDYFVLLFACSRLVGVRVNCLQRCVQSVEDDLLTMEAEIAEFVENRNMVLKL